MFTATQGHSEIREWTKLILGAVFLMPMRICMLVIGLVVAWLAASIYLWNKPQGNYGHGADVKSNAFLTFMVNRATRLQLFAFGETTIEFRGKVPKDCGHPAPWLQHSIVAAPHTSVLDWTLVLANPFRLLSPTAKQSINKVPITGKFTRMTMPVYIDRSSRESRSDAANDIKTRMREGHEKGWFPLLIFPEGTTQADRRQLMTFKKGAFLAGEPVIPVIISYPTCDGPTKNDWVTAESFGRGIVCTLIMLLCRLRTVVRYTFLDPYQPNEEEKSDPALYAENVRQYMAREGNLTTTNWSFLDVQLMYQCVKAKMPSHIGAINALDLFRVDDFTDAHRRELTTSLLDSYLKILTTLDLAKIPSGKIPAVEKKRLLSELFPGSEPVAVDPTAVKFYKTTLPPYVTFECLASAYATLNSKK